MFSIEVFHSTQDAAPLWRKLEAENPGLVYQRFTWNDAWFRTIGAVEQTIPAIVHVRAQGQSALLPLAISNWHALRIAQYAGGKHNNSNGPLAPASFPWPQSAQGILELFGKIGSAIGDIDAFDLQNQLADLNGHVHPFFAAPHVAAASDFYQGALEADFQALAVRRMKADRRKKLRSKERRLAELGQIRFVEPQTAEEAKSILATFFRQKEERFRQMGIADPFADPGAQNFLITAACEHLGTADVALRLLALEVNGTPVAIFGSLQDSARYAGVFTSFADNGEIAKSSPGEILLQEEIRRSCERGKTMFDLGIGTARYKTIWCDRAIPVFETYHGVTSGGSLYATARRMQARAKRRIKTHPALFALFRKMRPATD